MKLVQFTQRDHGIGHGAGCHSCGRLGDRERSNAFRTVTGDSVIADNFLDLGNQALDKDFSLRRREIYQSIREEYRVVVFRWKSVRICEVFRISTIKNRIVNSRLRLGCGLCRVEIIG